MKHKPEKLAWVLGALLVFLTASCSQARQPAGEQAAPKGKPFEGQTLKVAMWGGGWLESQKAAVGNWVEQTTGAKIEYVVGNPRDHIAKMIAAKGGEPPFDVVQMDDINQEIAIREGLLEPIDPSAVPGFKDVFPEAFANKGYGPGFVIIQIGIAYNTEEFKKLGLEEPKRISDLWNPKLKGKVAVPGLGVVMGPYGLVATAIEFGGNIDNVEPGFAKYKELDPIVYTDSTKLETMFVNKEVIAAIWIDGRTNTLRDKGFPIKFVRPIIGSTGLVGMAGFDVVDIVKGTKKKQLALAWIDRQFSVEAQMIHARRDNYSPTLKTAAAEFAKDPKYKEQFITDPKDMEKTLRLDARKVNTYLPKWIDMWNRSLAK